MSKPFNEELERESRIKEEELVKKLNQIFKKLRAKLGPGRDHNIELLFENRKVAAMEVEVIPQEHRDRWDKIKTKYRTVRWPIAKKKYAENNIPVFMATTPPDLSDILYIDAKTWVNEGKEEKERVVRAGGRTYIYRAGSEERFWAIDKNKVHWGYEGLEE